MLGQAMSRIVGLTGGIGSGKSTVAEMFRALGAVVVDADAIVHELQAPGAPMLDELALAFGSEIVRADGSLDREALADIVFRDESQRKRLNAIVHPAVGIEFEKRVAAAVESAVPVVVLDIPLFFEGRRSGRGSAAVMKFDATVVVWVPEAVQIERTVARDGCSAEAAERRIRAQMPLDEKRALADYVITNDGTPAEARAQVEAVYRAISEVGP